LSADCGQVADGCGNLTPSCGTCVAPHICGGGGPNVCGGGNGNPNCVPQTCQTLSANCGPVADGCGGLIASCGSCALPSVGGGDGTPNVCSNGGMSCVNFCLQQVACGGGATTTLTGTVHAPSGWLPLPGALVYVPNGSTSFPYGVQSFVDGV